MNITLYSTGCPQCKVLKAKLDQAGIKYNTVSDQATMVAMGFKSAPILQVDNTTYKFAEAIKWIREQQV
jgi:glutaredoxin